MTYISECKNILGVFLVDDMSFKTHIFSVLKNPKRCVIYCYMISLFKKNNSLISLYKVYVRFLLNCASIIHPPYEKYLIDQMENFQGKCN